MIDNMKKLFALTLLVSNLIAKYGPENKDGPWYTGSFFSTSGEVTELGTISLQWYLFIQQIYAHYDRDFSLEDRPGLLLANPVLLLQTGVAPKVDTQLTFSGLYQKTEEASDFVVNDFQLQLGMQLYKSTLFNPWPDLRLTITETFPTAKFDKGDPKKEGTDIGGSGSFLTAIGLNLQNIYFLDTYHPTRMRLNLWVTIPTSVRVKGINFFGGEENTKGKVTPGINLQCIYSPEVTITQNWVFTCDIIYNHTFPTGFKGRLIASEVEKNSLLGAYDSLQFSPAIEYNFDADSGILFGGWFTLIGKRSPSFAGGAISMVYAW